MTPTRTRGITLIEVLAACALLSFFMVAASSWLVASASLTRDVAANERRSAAITQTLAVLHDDLLAAQPGSLDISTQHVTLITASQTDDPSGAWQNVAWRVDSVSGHLIRAAKMIGSTATQERNALVGIRDFVVEYDPDLQDNQQQAIQRIVVTVSLHLEGSEPVHRRWDFHR